jgi:hypothetical protein
MRKLYLLTCVTFMLALAPQWLRADESSEPPLAPEPTVEQSVPGDPGLGNAPGGVSCPRLKKFCEWLCYQPLDRKCKACRWTPYPCCQVHPYALFPCVDCGSVSPVSAPACTSCAARVASPE